MYRYIHNITKRSQTPQSVQYNVEAKQIERGTVMELAHICKLNFLALI